MRSAPKFRLSLAIAALAFDCTVAMAAPKQPAGQPLPGVDTAAGDTVVGVKSPEPAQSDPGKEPTPDGFVRMGDWDVKISGYVRVDIGAGSVRGGHD